MAMTDTDTDTNPASNQTISQADYETAREGLSSWLATTPYSTLEDLQSAYKGKLENVGSTYKSQWGGFNLDFTDATDEQWINRYIDQGLSEQEAADKLASEKAKESYWGTVFGGEDIYNINPNNFTKPAGFEADLETAKGWQSSIDAYENAAEAAGVTMDGSTAPTEGATGVTQEAAGVTQEGTEFDWTRTYNSYLDSGENKIEEGPDKGKTVYAAAGYSSAAEYASAMATQAREISETYGAGAPMTEAEITTAMYKDLQETKERERLFRETVWGSDEDLATAFKNFFTSQEEGIRGQKPQLLGQVEQQYDVARESVMRNMQARGIDPSSGLGQSMLADLETAKAESTVGAQQYIDQQLLGQQQNFLMMGLGMQPTGQEMQPYYATQLGQLSQEAQMGHQLQMQQLGFQQQNSLALMQYGWQHDLMQQQIDAQRAAAPWQLLGGIGGAVAGGYAYNLMS